MTLSRFQSVSARINAQSKVVLDFVNVDYRELTTAVVRFDKSGASVNVKNQAVEIGGAVIEKTTKKPARTQKPKPTADKFLITQLEKAVTQAQSDVDAAANKLAALVKDKAAAEQVAAQEKVVAQVKTVREEKGQELAAARAAIVTKATTTYNPRVKADTVDSDSSNIDTVEVVVVVVVMILILIAGLAIIYCIRRHLEDRAMEMGSAMQTYGNPVYQAGAVDEAGDGYLDVNEGQKGMPRAAAPAKKGLVRQESLC